MRGKKKEEKLFENLKRNKNFLVLEDSLKARAMSIKKVCPKCRGWGFCGIYKGDKCPDCGGLGFVDTDLFFFQNGE